MRLAFRKCGGDRFLKKAISVPLRCFAIVAALALTSSAAADEVAPYEAFWADGTRTTSATPLEWINQELKPTLGQRSPVWGENPLRRLRTTALARPADLGGRVELAGGDRLTGRIIEFLPARNNFLTDELRRPECLVVEPLVAPDQPTPDVPVRLHVPVERVRRVVWEERTPRMFRPNTLYYRDGRQTTFRSLRWSPGSVRLLVEQGVEEVAWDEVAEVQLAERDPWEEYADQLALLTPDLSSKLVRFETTGGLRMTVSLDRIRATGDVSKPETQLLVVQPAWSLEGLTIPLQFITAATFFTPREVPLSNFEPAVYVHKAALAGGWKQWRCDANVQGDPLAAGDREYGWGFGVHAHAELGFDLTLWARAFRTGLALDRAADDGGCAKGKIYFGPVLPTGALPNRPLYESPAIVGSVKNGERPLDSGRLELRPQPGRVNRLTLVADALPYERPAGSDPLDVRDVFDWLEPIVELDEALLKTAVTKHAASMFVREHGWTIAGAYGETWQLTSHGYGNQWRSVVEVLKSPLAISRSVAIPADAESLVVRGGAVGQPASVTKLKLTVGGAQAMEVDLPVFADAKNPPTLRLPLPPTARGRTVRCELTFTTTQQRLRYDVQGISVATPPAK